MLSIIFLALAAICNSIIDVTQFHFSQSVFNSIHAKEQWWNGLISWKNKYINGDIKQGRKKLWKTDINYPVQLTDAFHFFKSLMIVLICAAIISFDSDFMIFKDQVTLSYIVLMVIYGTIWNVMFSLFYNKILIR